VFGASRVGAGVLAGPDVVQYQRTAIVVAADLLELEEAASGPTAAELEIGCLRHGGVRSLTSIRRRGVRCELGRSAMAILLAVTLPTVLGVVPSVTACGIDDVISWIIILISD